MPKKAMFKDAFQNVAWILSLPTFQTYECHCRLETFRKFGNALGLRGQVKCKFLSLKNEQLVDNS